MRFEMKSLKSILETNIIQGREGLGAVKIKALQNTIHQHFRNIKLIESSMKDSRLSEGQTSRFRRKISQLNIDIENLRSKLDDEIKSFCEDLKTFIGSKTSGSIFVLKLGTSISTLEIKIDNPLYIDKYIIIYFHLDKFCSHLRDMIEIV